MDGDLLSELLAPMRLHGVFHSRWSMRAPWGVAGAKEDCAILHYIQDGTCTVELPGHDPVELAAGDLVLFPHGTAHQLADAPGRPSVPLESLLPARQPGEVTTLERGGPGPATTLLCGGLHYDRAATAPLYQALPPVLVVRAGTQPLLTQTLENLAGEWVTREPGGQLVALRAFELVYVLALRACMAETSLAALRHPAVSAALLAVQTRFAEPWTVETLAAEAGLSRSAFAATFRELVGEAPMRHLTARRMQEAARLLTETALAHERISERVGYRSTVGFHLAFKAWYGTPPGEFRRRVSAAGGPRAA
ncbi:AraC family transcriptional regulator [Nonomuraea sp. NPDC050556]|uniref:AraC family transcriptional regulator n=1 Tax=Nonomuraea sp. NPDC050556 TaxID=3364369 RepID=UPI0037922131